ncbi:UNKNOWN [Stylonychia lemnae]|uniref:Rubisco LSMT substrate-binding domain-containing protein n=1 Tax=Stylonychia lemnae TaxID=5949 RepID=A0A078A5S1_STYLE|nr:UNKNOWN [Stylonychia lemnae]|eukprot:CDW77595.1 UNKNOWN [Stylonychia lemnae]
MICLVFMTVSLNLIGTLQKELQIKTIDEYQEYFNNQIKKLSDYIEVRYQLEKGLHTVVVKDIDQEQETILNVPARFVSSFYDHMHDNSKWELFEIVREVWEQQGRTEIFELQGIMIALLQQDLYNKYVKNWSNSTNEDDIFMWHYLTYLKHVLILDDLGLWNEEQTLFYQQVTLDRMEDDLNRKQLFNEITQQLRERYRDDENKHKLDDFMQTMGSFEDFTIWMSAVCSRSHSIQLEVYLEIKGDQKEDQKLREEKAQKFEQIFGIHVLALQPILDLTNHYTKELGKSDIDIYLTDGIKGSTIKDSYFTYTADSAFQVGEEFVYTYMSHDQTQIKLFKHYGMVLSNNVDSYYEFSINDPKRQLNKELSQLCSSTFECFEEVNLDKQHLSYKFRLNLYDISQPFYNFLRFLNIQQDPNYDLQNVITSLNKDGFISYENEQIVFLQAFQILQQEYERRLTIEELNQRVMILEQTQGVWQNDSLRRQMLTYKVLIQTQQVILTNMNLAVYYETQMILRQAIESQVY